MNPSFSSEHRIVRNSLPPENGYNELRKNEIAIPMVSILNINDTNKIIAPRMIPEPEAPPQPALPKALQQYSSA